MARDVLPAPTVTRPGFVPTSALLVGLGCDVDTDGWVTVGTTGGASVPGVWAAGNIVDPRAQVITAGGAGSAAAIAINADLVEEDVRNAVLDLDHGFALTATPNPSGVSMTTPPHQSPPTKNSAPSTLGPPSKHQLALMIWLAVFPTLLGLNLILGDWLRTMSPVLRTFVLATTAAPIVIYGLMPQLHRARRRLMTRSATS